ncbi:leptin-like [Bombina bombina]|uniref:leptin-like n=1 Tax=Bombina bombina TaxID=8345 RepID=UPI00235A7561|nr:leptin-like [Bombina bombina]
MHYTHLPFCGLLWLWMPLCQGRPIKPDGINKLKADAVMISKTLITRIQEHPIQFLFPSNLKISGLDFIPDKQPLESLEHMDETLEIFQKILSSISLENVDQMLSDMENLRSLLKLLSDSMGCPARKPMRPDSLVNLTEEYANAPYTTEKVTLDRLQKSLDNIVKHLDHVKCS